MLIVSFTGTLGADCKTNDTKSGSVCNFNVAVRMGKDETQWIRCALWGQRGQQLAQHLTKGAKVAGSGRLSLSEYDGKTQLNVDVFEIDPFCGGKREQESRGNGGGSGRGRSPFDSELDDDIPFATASPDFERRLS